MKLAIFARVGLIVALLLSGVDVCAGEKSDPKVKATAAATKLDKDGKQTVTITLEIEKGFLIYANPIGHKDFEYSQTEVRFKAKDKTTAIVKYPAGTANKVFASSPVEYSQIRSYERKVTVEAVVERTLGDSSPLQVEIEFWKLRYDPGIACFGPGAIKLTLP